MRKIALFRAEPAISKDKPGSQDGAATFTDDPSRLVQDGERWTVYAVHLSPAQMSKVKRHSDAGSYTVPQDIGRKATRVSREDLERMAIMRAALLEARSTRRSMVLEKEDCVIGGEMASVARLLWRHIPEAAAKMGIAVADDEGGPILQHFPKDLERSRPVADHVGFREDASFLRRIASGDHPAMRIVRDMAAQITAAAAMSQSARGMAY